MKKRRIIIAFGGNALIKKGQAGTIKEQFNNTNNAVEHVLPIIKEGHKIAFTHGNGPIVGFSMLRIEAGEKHFHTPYSPLGIAVADSQGGIGYMIQNCLHNSFFKNKIKKEVVTILTQVLVDKEDPSFNNPAKPIGPFYTKKEAIRLAKEKEWVVKEDSGRGYRRFVPSPYPVDIIENKIIKQLFDKGILVIACGGGGIAVIHRDDKTLKGIPAVIDKDLASFVLAKGLKADLMMILTSVEKVAINFGKKNQKNLSNVKLKEIKEYHKQGHFGEGSMEPKIRAAIMFLENGGKEVIICSIDKAYKAFCGKTGTRITR